MSVKFRSAATDTNADGVDETTVTVPVPPETAEGDVMIALIAGPANSVGASAPAGWESLSTANDGSLLLAKAYRRIASASEPADYTFTASGTPGAVNGSIASFAGGSDVVAHVGTVTGTDNPATAIGADAVVNSIGYQVYLWRDDNADLTVSFDQGLEVFDVQSQGSGVIRRGQSGTYYGPPALPDIVNAGDELPGAIATANGSTPEAGIFWTFLIADKEPDNLDWDDTDGAFAVELRLDRTEYDMTGSASSKFLGDNTAAVVAFDASMEVGANVVENLADGLTSTRWTASPIPAWAQYDFGSGNAPIVRRYRLASGTSAETLDPAVWELQGSNNGVDFTVLDSRSSEAFGLREEMREFRVSSPGAYRYYRLEVTGAFDGDVDMTLAEWRTSTIPMWEDVTPFVNWEDKIRITRGLQGTTGRSDYSRAYFTFNNTDGRFSIANQNGAYFGAIQRNTPVRISKAYGTTALQLQGGVATAGTDMVGDALVRTLAEDVFVFGDIDIRVDIEPAAWQQLQTIAGVSRPGADGVGALPWAFYLNDEGRLFFDWTANGFTPLSAGTTETLDPATRQTVRVTLDADDGAGGLAVTFYVGDSVDAVSWTQVGDPITAAFTTGIAYPGGSLCVGHLSGVQVGVPGLNGSVYAIRVLDGIDGTPVVDLDFTAMDSGTRSFSDGTATWLAVKDAVISNRRYRFHGEVAEWPIAWDTTGTWIYAESTGAGPQRRLEKGPGDRSALYRHHTVGIIADPGADYTAGAAYAYWPCEDGENAFEIGSALPDRPPMQIYGGPPELASASPFVESGPLPQLKGAKFGGRVAGNPVDYADIRFVMYAPEALSAGANIMTLYTTGIHPKITLDYSATNTWRVALFDEDDVETGTITDSSTGSVTTEDQLLHVQMLMQPNFSNTDIFVNVYSTLGVLQGSVALFKAQPLGRVYRVNINDGTVDLHDDTTIGHIAVYGEDAPPLAAVFDGARYETATERVERLAREELIEYRQVGADTGSQFMGSQGTESAFALMSSAASSENGFLIEPRAALGVELRTLRSLLNRSPHLTLDYSAGELSGELLPVGDDSYIENDVTVNRGGAGSARFRVTEGALSVQAPPQGVGEYSSSFSLSLAHEGQCGQIASWVAHRGTVDEYHFNRVEVALENQRVAADPALIERILTLDVGVRVDITNPPAFLPVEDIRQTVIGYEEWFDNFQHYFTLNTIPERVYEVARWDRDYRYDTAGSAVVGSLSTTATTMRVQTTKGPKWSTTADDFDVKVDGERMTVTAVTDAPGADTTDSFTRADSATDLGDTETGTIYTWDQVAGTWGISGNEAYQPSATAEGQAVFDTGVSDFEEVAVTVAGTGSHFVVFRSAGATLDWCRWGGITGGAAELHIEWAGANFRTEVSDHIVALGDRLSVRCAGSVIEAFVNGVMKLTITEATNSHLTHVGMMTSISSSRFDDFAFNADSSVQDFTVTRSVNGVVAPHQTGSEVTLYQPPYRGL